jgi:lipopolysaccharide assembly protein A
MQIFRWIVATTVFIALLFLSLQNADTVTLRFFQFASWQAPLVFVVLIAFALGVAAGLLAGAFRSARLNRQLKRLRREQRQHGAAPASDSRAGSAGAATRFGSGSTRDDRSHDGG